MRTLAITQNLTLDGRVEMLDDWFDDQAQADDDALLEENHRQDDAADAFLCGRQTLTDLRGYWRDLADDRTGISAYLTGVQKYVVSSTLGDPEWDRTTVISGDPLDAVRELKQQPGKDIVVTGSIRLCHALVEADLVDEYRFFTYPVVQGRGRCLFPEGTPPARLERLAVRGFGGGITLTTYAAR